MYPKEIYKKNFVIIYVTFLIYLKKYILNILLFFIIKFII